MNVTVRVIFGSLVAVLAGVIGGVILGEYELVGVVAILAGGLFGLAVAEAVITAAKTSAWLLVGVAGLCAFAGFSFAGYIDAGDSFGRIDSTRWVGSLVAAAAAGAWVRKFGSRALRKLFD